MRPYGKRLVLLVWLLAAPALAHEAEVHPSIVIDTDLGLDDAVTLALALQNPHVNVTAVVACEGAASAEKSVEYLERMLHLFNRRDIPLYAPVATKLSRRPPPFRDFAERAVGRALPTPTQPFCRPFSPAAYVSARGKTVVLALGPLTNLAAALHAKPEIKRGIARVILPGAPDANWNLDYDPAALAAVQATGLPTDFVVPAGRAARKPESWRLGELTIGRGTSIGEAFVRRLLEAPQVRHHYTQQLEDFSDELAFLYCVAPTVFQPDGRPNRLTPSSQTAVINLFTRLLSDGRQNKERVIFVDRTLPESIFQEDLRARRARIIANHGKTEWFAQLLTNELHQHLGAYSVVGVKMGLRAAELLNAPQHAMNVVARVPARPPASCLNDGLMVATGCTPGRMLFTHTPGAPDTVAADFQYNGRRLTLALKAEYRAKIRAAIAALLEEYTLEDRRYWDGVRRLGLDIWENWHRRDLFEVVGAPAAPN